MEKYKDIKPGDLIISSPFSNIDPIFNKTVILILTHNENSITGIIINRALNHVDNSSIRLSLEKSNLSISKTDFDLSNLVTYFGGPTEPDKGIILHSSDYNNNISTKINDSIFITSELKIFADIIDGKGPSNKMMILGHVTWETTQLFEEIKNNTWILLANEPEHNDFYQLVFLEDFLSKWQEALRLAKIDITHYSNIEGHA